MESSCNSPVSHVRYPRMALNPDVKNIFDFGYEDFQLTGYDPHPHIKGEVAI